MPRMNIPCPVCGKYIFNQYKDYDICKYCGWENDDWFEEGGANYISFEDYKKRYEAYLELNPKYIWTHDGLPEITLKDKCQLIHKYSIHNHDAISKSSSCGCFYCEKIFDKALIEDWVNDKNGETALCPFCGIDSVLPDSIVDLSEDLLNAMYKLWFE